MTYNPSIPQPSDLLSDSQGQFLTNFGALNTLYGLDHYSFNNATSGLRGLHQKSSYVAQAADPANAATIDQVYTKQVIYSGPLTNTELFIKNASDNSTNSDVVTQLTNSLVVPQQLTTGPGGSAAITYLAGGLIMISYYHVTALGSSGTISWQDGSFTFPTGVLGFNATPLNGSSLLFAAGTASTTGFTYTASGTLTGITYIAIGY